MINVAREAMLAIGCIQAQQCHTGHCPTGIATQRSWLVGGLDPTLKAARLANYLITLRKEILQIAAACGEPHPALVPLDRFDLVDGFQTRGAREVFGYNENWGRPGPDALNAIRSLEGPRDDAAA
jgi:glutamate synthase (ferredoxin)